MGRTVLLSEVREAVRNEYDLPTFTSTTFISTTIVNAFINRALQRYYGLLMECYGDNYFAAAETLVTSAGIEVTSVPERFHKLIALHWMRGDGDWLKLRPATVDDIRRSSQGAVSWSESRPKYRLSNTGALEWFPPPNDAYDVRCDYVAIPADLTEDGGEGDDAFDAGPGWEDYVIADVCRRIAIKEEKDPSVWLSMRSEAEKHIREQAPQRDEGEGLAVRDVCYAPETASERFDRWTFE